MKKNVALAAESFLDRTILRFAGSADVPAKDFNRERPYWRTGGSWEYLSQRLSCLLGYNLGDQFRACVSLAQPHSCTRSPFDSGYGARAISDSLPDFLFGHFFTSAYQQFSHLVSIPESAYHPETSHLI